MGNLLWGGFRLFLSVVLVFILMASIGTYLWLVKTFIFYPGTPEEVTLAVWFPAGSVVSEGSVIGTESVERLEMAEFQTRVVSPTVWVHTSWNLFTLEYFGKADKKTYVASATVASYGLNHKLDSYRLDTARGEVTLVLRQHLVTDSRWGWGWKDIFVILPLWPALVIFSIIKMLKVSWPYSDYAFAYT